MLRFIDTFAGIGGFHLAMQEVDPKARCVLSMEIDKGACKTYARNFGIDSFCDVTEKEAKTYPDHDILFGGFPCQPFSRNGKYYNKNDKRLGDDDRKNLVFYLMEVLRVKKPSFFVFENVKEILTILNEDGSSFFDALMENLGDCGYDVACGVVDTKNFGIPQQRRRAYFVGARKDLGVKYVFPNGKKPNRCVRDVMDAAVDEKYLLKNLWVNRKYGAQDGRPISWIIKAMREKNLKSRFVDLLEKDYGYTDEPPPRLDVLRLAVASGEWSSPDSMVGKIHPLGIIYGDTPSLLPRQQDKLYSNMGISPTIATFSTPCFESPQGWRALTPRECMRLQGFPESFLLHEDDTMAYKQAGNAVTVRVAAAVIGRLFDIVNGKGPIQEEEMPMIEWGQ